MGALSAQVFALVFILIPGCIAFLSFGLGNGRTKLSMQRGLLMETALFVLTATILHLVVGVFVIPAAEALTYCRVIDSLVEVIGKRATSVSPKKVCGIDADASIFVGHMVVVCVAAWLVGRWFARRVASSRSLFMALNGPYYDWTPPGEAPIIIADVLTDIEHDGKYLMYEGKLEEIGLSASKTIEYVCLISPQRFLLRVDDGTSSTTERAQFVAVDKLGRGTSRIVIAGDQIKNFLTRTHLIETPMLDDSSLDEAPPLHQQRREVILPRWFIQLCATFRHIRDKKPE